MTPALLAAGLLHAMIVLAPPDRADAKPGWEETIPERTARFSSIAADVAAVVLDPAVLPLPGRSREETADLLIALGVAESAFAADVDRGPCWRGARGTSARCDGGRSACFLQVKLGVQSTIEGWTQADLFADRRKCIVAGLRVARRSFGACALLGSTHLLDAYASGRCGQGTDAGEYRLGLARRVALLAMPPVSTTSAKGLQ